MRKVIRMNSSQSIGGYNKECLSISCSTASGVVGVERSNGTLPGSSSDNTRLSRNGRLALDGNTLRMCPCLYFLSSENQ